MSKAVVVGMLIGLGLCAAGCGGSAPPTVSVDQQAAAKVDAFRRIAEDAEKNPTGQDVLIGLEEFRQIPFDARGHAKEANEILELYRKRVQAKVRGEVADQLRAEMAGIEAALKRK